MADATTDLTVPGDNMDLESAEQKSGFMDALGSVDMLRQIILVVALAICVAIAIFIVILFFLVPTRHSRKFSSLLFSSVLGTHSDFFEF